MTVPRKNQYSVPLKPASVALLFVFFVFFSPLLLAQYVIKGKIYTAGNKEALPFVPVIIKGTTIGAQSDFDGNFIINASKLGDSLIASYVGYKRSARPINKNLQTQVINIPMDDEGGVTLETIDVKAGENPANRIVRNCVRSKDKNNRRNLDAFEYETYNKIEFDLNRIPKEMREKKLMKPIKFVFDNVDSVYSGEKPSLPFFIVENLSQFYYKKPDRKKEVIIASKSTGMENSSVSQVLGDMYQNINIYDNNILVFNKQLPSPVSENGFFYYKYYLEDSAFEGNRFIYHIRFKPKRVQELSFTGNMWIADTTWGIKRLEMSLPKDANINFINGVNVTQEFTFADSVWFLSKDRLTVDFAPTKKAIGFYGRKTTSYKNLKLNQAYPDKFYGFADKIDVSDSVLNKSDQFWEEHRHDSLTVREKRIREMMDTIKTLPVYSTWVDIFYLLVAGYKKVNNFEIGPLSNLVSYNRVEGMRLRFGGRTSDIFSTWYELAGYVAYGMQDEKWKYFIGFRSFLSKTPVRQLVGMSYKSDYEILGQSTNGFSQDNLLASFFRSSPLNNLTRVDKTEAYYEREWFPGLITKTFLTGRQYTPLGVNKYEYYKKDGTIAQKENIVNTEARMSVRFAWKEKYVGTGFSRVYLGTTYPVLQVIYAKSLQNAFKGEYDYHKVVVNVSDRIRITPILGYTDYVLEGGKIWGQVPYPLMELHGGNQTYIYDYMAFNMMRYYEFASDQFVSLGVFHHFEGLFFNKIPLLRKLKWREVVTGKAVWGSVNDQNRKTLIFPTFPTALKALDKGPYVEASAGIENIFKIFRIDAFWRMTYQYQNPLNNFGVKFGFQLAL